MTHQNCLEMAMRAAHESYSVSVYDAEDCGEDHMEDGTWTPVTEADASQSLPISR